MAKKKSVKVKVGKKRYKIPLTIFIVLVVVLAIGFGVYYYLNYVRTNDSDDGSSSSAQATSHAPGTYDEISFHFLQLGNEYAGDSIYVKAGSNDILIDAGSRSGSAETIEEYVDRYCTDGKLEYVIATHAHQDHIAAFAGNKSGDTRTGILYHYEVGTIIDFPKTDATSTTYTNYVNAVTYATDNGAKHFTALQCYNNEGDGAQRTYTLGEGLTMEILYNYFYDHGSTSEEVTALDSSFTSGGFSDENDYSVSVLFSQGEKHFLFTGDSEAYAEYSLTRYNDLPECDLFKAGHHGSYTASGDALLSVIKPKTVVVCCVAGSDEYTSAPDNMFPATAALKRIAQYTDDVYVTSVASSDNSDGYAALNGDVVVSYASDGTKTIAGSDNSKKLKDSDWFNSEWYASNREAIEEWAS
jgi:beta-lactamase superfamily II metal-dependent hydrolase